MRAAAEARKHFRSAAPLMQSPDLVLDQNERRLQVPAGCQSPNEMICDPPEHLMAPCHKSSKADQISCRGSLCYSADSLGRGMGLVIGKKGEHLKSVEKDFKAGCSASSQANVCDCDTSKRSFEVTVHIEKDDTSKDTQWRLAAVRGRTG